MKNYHEKEKISKFVLFAILFIVSGVCVTSCGPYQYAIKQTEETVAAIHILLISENYCFDVNDCRRKNYVLTRPENGAYIYIYGITDKKIIIKIVDLFIEQHARYPNTNY